MAAFEITHSARNGSNTTGSVQVERTGKVYNFLALPNGNVMLANGTRAVPANQLRDFRFFVSKRFAVAPDAPAMVPQQSQPQQADAGRRGFLRTALTAGLLAATAAPAVAKGTHQPRALRGDDTARLPDHAAFWARLPLPFSLTDAWHMLSPATQTEIGGAVLGMALANYVYGDGRADADQFTDEGLRAAASNVADDLLNRIDDRLWVLLPDLYGPDGDHPRWAYDGSMVYPLGTVLQDAAPAPAPASVAAATDPIFAAIEAADAARQAHQAMHEGLDEDDAAQMARLGALVDADRAAFEALAETIPTTRKGDVALADFYLRTLDDPDGQATAHLEHLRNVLAGDAA